MDAHLAAREPRTVVVVGAGLAGLTAAATAADAERHVTLLEAREHAGGRARTSTVDGFHLNQGAHALYRGGRRGRPSPGFGITPQGMAPDASCAIGLRADGTLARCRASGRTLLRTMLFGWRTKVELARLLARPAGWRARCATASRCRTGSTPVRATPTCARCSRS